MELQILRYSSRAVSAVMLESYDLVSVISAAAALPCCHHIQIELDSGLWLTCTAHHAF